MKLNQFEIFYHPHEINSNVFTLDRVESNHCIKVLRQKENDRIHIINGVGLKIIGKIIDPNPKSTKIEIIKKEQIKHEITNKIHIAIGPTKNINRFEWFLEKSVELGLNEITPIISDNSERTKINSERLNKKMITALKQSRNPFLPKLNPILKFSEIIQNNANNQKFICHNENPNVEYLKNKIKSNSDITILIGPEGGFSEQEVRFAEQNGFEQVLLGNNRYRTETAGILALHTIHLLS